MWYRQDTQPQVDDPQTRKILQLQRSFSRSEESKPHLVFLSLEVLNQEGESPESLALKTTRAYIWESWRAVGKRNSTLTGRMQNLTPSGSQCRGSSLKGAWVRPT